MQQRLMNQRIKKTKVNAWGSATLDSNAGQQLKIGLKVQDVFGTIGIITNVIPNTATDYGCIEIRTEHGYEKYIFHNWESILRSLTSTQEQ